MVNQQSADCYKETLAKYLSDFSHGERQPLSLIRAAAAYTIRIPRVPKETYSLSLFMLRGTNPIYEDNTVHPFCYMVFFSFGQQFVLTNFQLIQSAWEPISIRITSAFSGMKVMLLLHCTALLSRLTESLRCSGQFVSVTCTCSCLTRTQNKNGRHMVICTDINISVLSCIPTPICAHVSTHWDTYITWHQ